MMSLNEMFGTKLSPSSSFVIPTYSALEGGNVDLSYQLEVTLNANIQGRAKQEKLVSYMKNTRGYDTCDVDTGNNTVRVYNLSGIDSVAILKYVKKHMDKNASVQQISEDG